MPISEKAYRQKTFATVKSSRMAYIEYGGGDAIVFQHGNPTSSYLWRNIMPYCERLGRLIACDLIGMGDSDKLENSGPERYTYAEQCSYLFALWDQIGLGDKVILVLHDWGSAMGFRLGQQESRPSAGHRLHGSDRHAAYLGRLARECTTCVSGFPIRKRRGVDS